MSIDFMPVMVSLLSLYLVRLGMPAPAYFAAVLLFWVFVARLAKLRINQAELGFVVALFSFVVFLFLNGGNYDVLTFAFVFNLLLAFFSFLSLLTLRRETDWLTFSKQVFLLFIVVGFFDTAYKFYFPLEFDEAVVEGRDFYEFGFYQFKGSFFYQDSNGLAYLMIPVMALGFEIWRSMKASGDLIAVRYRVMFCAIPAVLIFLTLSRAAMLAATVLYLLYFVRLRVVVVLLVLLGVTLSGFLVVYLESDLSGGTKLNELSAVLEHLGRARFADLIAGVGFGRGEELSGRYIHGALQKIFLELGFLGIFLYSAALFFLFSMRGVWRSLLALLLMSFSSNFYFLPAFVVCVFLLIEKLNLSRHSSLEKAR